MCHSQILGVVIEVLAHPSLFGHMLRDVAIEVQRRVSSSRVSHFYTRIFNVSFIQKRVRYRKKSYRAFFSLSYTGPTFMWNLLTSLLAHARL